MTVRAIALTRNDLTRPLLWLGGLAVLALLVVASLAPAGETLPRADERFAAADVEETPDLQRHVLPLLGRLGCNGRACHGSFQGQGGFRLSLFGYDFAEDHKALLDDSESEGEPRVNTDKPRLSLILRKPTLQDDHEGGRRMDKDSWQYRLLLRWVEGGAKPVPKDHVEFSHLEASPSVVRFDRPGQTAQLQVVAHWADGTSEDVTPLCRFRTNDEALAEIDHNGTITGKGKGDTHVVVFYDNGVAPVEVITPVSDRIGERFPKLPAPTKIDELIQAKLQTLGIVPSELCDDSEFLRRVSLDITGTLPTVEEVRAFLDDKSTDKRARKIDELLERPAYAAWWATKLCDITGNNERNSGEAQFRREQFIQWYDWIHERIKQNVPYDELVAGIVLAKGREDGEDYEAYCNEMTGYVAPDGDDNFAERKTMPHYWSRRTLRQPEEKALAFAHDFLGVRIQCAQCHKHPFDQWSKQDFDQFKAFFAGVQYGISPEARDENRKMTDDLGLKGKRNQDLRRMIPELLREGKTLPWREVFVLPPRVVDARDRVRNRNRRAPTRVITPKLLGGEELVARQWPDPRAALMEWMRDKGNPYFAPSIVNRVWAHYFGVGIVEPADDLNLANPPSNKALFDYLAAEFIGQGYDLKWLHRTIANSAAYQRSWQPNDTNRLDRRQFSHALVRRLPAEVAYDALVCATSSDQANDRFRRDVDSRSIGLGIAAADRRSRRNNNSYVLTVFGKPPREISCDCERSNEPSLLQVIYLRNDQEALRMIDGADGWLRQLKLPGDANGREPRGDQRGAGFDIERMRRIIARARADGDQETLRRIQRRLATLRAARSRDDDRQREESNKGKQSDEKQAEKQESKDARPSSQWTAAEREKLIQQAYLRTLSRPASEDEVRTSQRHLADAKTPADGMRDLLWALINTKEFVVNH